MDTGTAIVIIAVLIFYLRLIILQRQRAKLLARPVVTSSGKKKRNVNATDNHQPISIRIISQNRRDWLIAGFGLVLMIFGLLIRAGVLPLVSNPYWWILTVLGLFSFSLAFR